MRHGATVHSRLNVESVSGFEGFPKYTELRQLAKHGAQAHLREGFQFNRGCGRFFATSGSSAAGSYPAPVWQAAAIIIVPKELVEGMDACNRGDTKGRCCVDENA
jgi:hypothetical protein